ncbi:MAG: formate dehydrogenase accessory protein FdhE [Thermodesulfobacteriota bacterium]
MGQAMDINAGGDGPELVQASSEDSVYAELLSFYKRVLTIRGDYRERLRRAITPLDIDDHMRQRLKAGFPLIDMRHLGIDVSLMNAYFVQLLSITENLDSRDKEQLTELAGDKGEFGRVIQQALQGRPPARYPQALSFFLKEILFPLLEVHAAHLNQRPAWGEWEYGYCPVCGGQPVLGVLRGEAGEKYLICGACKTKWSFPRLRCCGCGTREPAHLSYLTALENGKSRVEICDHCHTYLKVLDLRSTGEEMDADIENLTSLHLDMIARSKGYTNVNPLILPQTPAS